MNRSDSPRAVRDKRARSPLVTIAAVFSIVLGVSVVCGSLLTSGQFRGQGGVLILPGVAYLAMTRPATATDRVWPRSWGMAALVFIGGFVAVGAISFVVLLITEG